MSRRSSLFSPLPLLPPVPSHPSQELIPDPPTPLVNKDGRPKLKDVGAWLKRELRRGGAAWCFVWLLQWGPPAGHVTRAVGVALRCAGHGSLRRGAQATR